MGSNLFIPISYLLFFPTTEQYNPALLNQEAHTPGSLFAGAIMIFAIVVCFRDSVKCLEFMTIFQRSEKNLA